MFLLFLAVYACPVCMLYSMYDEVTDQSASYQVYHEEAICCKTQKYKQNNYEETY